MIFLVRRVFGGVVLGLMTGCGTLLPKSVEFFQDRVEPLPEPTPRQEERSRQAAEYVSFNASQIYEALTELQTRVTLLEESQATTMGYLMTAQWATWSLVEEYEDPNFFPWAPSLVFIGQQIDAAVSTQKDSMVHAGETSNMVEVARQMADDSRNLSSVVSTQQGIPNHLFRGDPDRLYNQLLKDMAAQRQAWERFEERHGKNVGAKIEGTGMFQIGYFSYIGGLLLIGFILFMVVTQGAGLGTGMKLARAGGRVVKVGTKQMTKVLREVVDGGERLKDRIKKDSMEGKTTYTNKELIAMFNAIQRENQSTDSQEIIDILTGKYH